MDMACKTRALRNALRRIVEPSTGSGASSSLMRSPSKAQWMSQDVEGSRGNCSETQEARAFNQRWELWGKEVGSANKEPDTDLLF